MDSLDPDDIPLDQMRISEQNCNTMDYEEISLQNGIKREPEENTNHFDPSSSKQPIVVQIEQFIERRYVQSTFIMEIVKKFQSEYFFGIDSINMIFKWPQLIAF